MAKTIRAYLTGPPTGASHFSPQRMRNAGFEEQRSRGGPRVEGRRGSRYVWRLGQCLALGWTLGEERSLTVASLLRFVLGIEVGAVVCHRTYRPAGGFPSKRGTGDVFGSTLVSVSLLRCGSFCLTACPKHLLPTAVELPDRARSSQGSYVFRCSTPCQ